MSEDEKLQEAARIRECALHDEASYIQDALDEGMAKGELNKTRKIVFRMIDRNSDDETIIDIADISPEQLDKFRKEYMSLR